jgi:hypothetical protein
MSYNLKFMLKICQWVNTVFWLVCWELFSRKDTLWGGDCSDMPIIPNEVGSRFYLTRTNQNASKQSAWVTMVITRYETTDDHVNSGWRFPYVAAANQCSRFSKCINFNWLQRSNQIKVTFIRRNFHFKKQPLYTPRCKVTYRRCWQNVVSGAQSIHVELYMQVNARFTCPFILSYCLPKSMDVCIPGQ